MKKIILGVLIVCSALCAGCRCSEPPGDEERLKARLDTTSVHVYVAVKVAIARTGDDPEIARAREQLVALITEASSGEHGDDSEGGKLSLGDALALGKAVWKLKGTGEDIVRGGKEDDLTPVLPLLLKEVGASGKIVAAMDANTEHALFFVVMSVLKAHEKSPVPIPVEVVLYEAWNTRPDDVKIPGAAAPLHAMKAWTYGNNDFCDLAADEARMAEEATFDSGATVAGLELFTGGDANISAGDLEKVDNGIRAIGHGGVAICHIARGDDKGARPSLSKFLDRIEKAGVSGEELTQLRVFLDCGGEDEEVARGLAKLGELEKGPGGQSEDTKLLRAYCEASDETSFEMARKISLGGKLLKVGLEAAEKSGVGDKFVESKTFRAAGGFAAAAEKVGSGASGVSDAVGGLKDSARGLLDRAKD